MSAVHPRCQGRAMNALNQVKRSCDNLLPHRIAHMGTLFNEACMMGPVLSGHQGVQLNVVQADMTR